MIPEMRQEKTVESRESAFISDLWEACYEMMKFGYDFYIVVGFLCGSILFGRLIPLVLFQVDVQKESNDGNPGTFNAFMCGGILCGLMVLLADVGKGLIPVAICARNLGINSWKFSLVMAAPVLGHAYSVFYKGHGGKAIAVSFGVLAGLYPVCEPLLILAGCYLLFAAVIPVKSNTRKSVYAFLLFAVLSLFTVRRRQILTGCIMISVTVIHKHCLKAAGAFRRGEEWRLE